MADFIAKAVSGGVITEFTTTPVELAQTLAPGQYDLRPIGGPVQRVTVLDVQNTAIPTISGSATPGGTLTTTNGTWTGVLDATTPYERRWLDLTSGETVINGAVAAAFSIPTSGYEGKLLAHEVRAQNARGQWTGWARSAVITVANLTFNVTDAEWVWAEDVDDAETRQGYATLTLLADLPAGKRPRFYRGPNAAGNAAQSAWMTGSGRNWTFDPVNAVDPGARDYAAIYMQSDDGSGPITQISSIKYFDASNVPGKPGLPSVTAGTGATGDVRIDPNDTPPSSGGIRPITGYGYSVDGGAVIALSGGAATTLRTVTIGGTLPVAVRVHAQNVNGWSVGSDPVTVTPPVITAGTNTLAPVIGGSLYAGGLAIVTPGEWTGSPAITRTIEQSNDGTTGWTTVATPIVQTTPGDVWDTALAGKYLRCKETPPTGLPVYSAVVGPLGAAYTHVLSLSGTQNYADHAVTPPFIGAVATGGVYLGAIAYYDGTTWDVGSQALLSLGNAGGTTRELSICGNSARGKDGSTMQPSLGTPVNPGWYICIAYLSKSGSTNTLRFLRNNDEAPTPGSNTNTYDFSAATWSTLRIGQLAGSTATNGGTNVPLDCVFAGKGDPTAFLAWMYNDGKIRRPTGYNFGTDPNGCTMNFFIDMARTAGGAWDATQIVDTYGVYSSWTFTATPSSNLFSWLARKPSFVMPFGDPLPTPPAYISPGFGTTDDIYTIESGLYSMAPVPAWTAKSYAMNNKVTNGGQTYRCLVPHVGTTFAADLSSGYWGVYAITVNSLTHSVLGNIIGNLSGLSYTCATPGVVTASVTLNGTTLNITSEIFAPQAMPATPQYATAWGGNGLVAAIQPYPAPAGAGTTYATVGALATALSSLTAGSTLIVNDLNDLNGATLTVPARNYGGATVICKNWEGFKCAAISMAGASNLTLIGFAVKGAISGNLMDGNITLDHCRAANLDMDGSGGHETTFNLTFTNHLCWEPGSGIPNAYSRFTRINRLTGYRWVMYGIDNTVGVFQMYKVGCVFFDRFFCGDAQFSGGTHPDLMQLTDNNSQGWFGGYIRNGFGFQRVARSGTKGFQGLFLTDNRLRSLSVRNVIMDTEEKSNIVFSGAQWNVRLEDCIAGRMINIKPSYPDSCLIKNNVMNDGDNAATAAILATPSMGYDTGNLGLIASGLVRGDLWPQYATWLGNWRAFANPNTGYETRGAAAMIAELEAKRVALGI